MAGKISVILELVDKNFGQGLKGAVDETSDFERKTQGVGNSIKGFGKDVGGSFKRVAGSALGMAGGIGIAAALGAAMYKVKDSVGQAMERIDTMEKFERVMTTMTGDTMATSDAVARLGTMLEGTSMRTDVMANSIQRFVTSGAEIGQATDWVEAFGNAVSYYGDGSTETFERVGSSLAKMTATGKVDMMQVNSIIEAGIPALDIMADATGKSVEEVKEGFADGSISAEDFVDTMTEALMEGTENFKDVSTAMKDEGLSWGAVMENIGNYVAIGIEDVMTAFDKMLIDNNLPDMREMIDEFGQAFGNVISALSPKIEFLGVVLGNVFEILRPVVDLFVNTFFPAMEEGTGIQDDFIARQEEGREKWEILEPVLTVIITALSILGIGFLALKAALIITSITVGIAKGAFAALNFVMNLNPLAKIALLIGALITIGVVLYKNWDKVTAATKKVWEAFKKTAFVKNLTSEIKRLGGWVKKVEDFFAGLGKKFGEFTKKITGFKMPPWVSTIGSSIGSGISALGKFSPLKLATGTNEVPHDMLANIHKGEMVVPAKQSANLRKQGVDINNIDNGGLNSVGRTRKVNVAPKRTGGETGSLKPLIKKLLESGGTGGGVTITGNNFHIREDADIDKVATALYRKMKATAFNMS